MKIIILAISTVLFIGLIIVIVFIKKYINKIENFKKLDLTDVYNNVDLCIEYNIGNKRDPKDYGFDYYEEEYLEKSDEILLKSWHIPAKYTDSKKAILFVHGRGSNRLNNLQYLEILKKMEVYKDYHVILPDLRNSGESDKSKTSMGFGVAKDIYAIITEANRKYGIEQFVMYSFSMGALATMITYDMYRDEFAKKNIQIEKVIMDSPLSNIKKVLLYRSAKMKLPKILSYLAVTVFTRKLDKKHRRLSKVIQSYKNPVLIIQSKEDETTPIKYLKNEKLDRFENVKINYFDKGMHVALYNKDNKNGYEKIVKDFLIN